MNIKKLTSAFFCVVISISGFAQNPIVQTYFTADPAPMVHDGKVYVYTSHDEDETVDNFFTMYDWRCYSSADMVNWTDHGTVASLKDFKWLVKTNGAWPPSRMSVTGSFIFMYLFMAKAFPYW